MDPVYIKPTDSVTSGQPGDITGRKVVYLEDLENPPKKVYVF